MATPSLLAETGYAYTLNWRRDEQVTPKATSGGK